MSKNNLRVITLDIIKAYMGIHSLTLIMSCQAKASLQIDTKDSLTFSEYL